MSEYSCNEHGHDFHEDCAACGAADDWASMEKRIAELESRELGWIHSLSTMELEKRELEQQLGNLLAVIHRDGGHYQKEYGTQWATEDAKRIVLDERQQLTELRDPAWKTYIELTKAFLEHYPPDIFTGVSGDPGPLFVVAIRNAMEALLKQGGE